jgi:hypothetical protein
MVLGGYLTLLITASSGYVKTIQREPVVLMYELAVVKEVI